MPLPAIPCISARRSGLTGLDPLGPPLCKEAYPMSTGRGSPASHPSDQQLAGDSGFAKTPLTILGHVFGPQLALWSPEWLPLTISLVLWVKELTLPKNRGLWAGDVVGGWRGDTRAVTPLAWQLPLEPRPSLKIQPRSNFNKVWKLSLGDAHGTLPCEVGGQGALSLPGSHPHPPKPACLPAMRPPRD